MNYFRLAEAKGVFKELDGWIRRRLRLILWRQWKRTHTWARNLMWLGLDNERAWRSVTNGYGPWWNAGASHMNLALPKDALVRWDSCHRKINTGDFNVQHEPPCMEPCARWCGRTGVTPFLSHAGRKHSNNLFIRIVWSPRPTDLDRLPCSPENIPRQLDTIRLHRSLLQDGKQAACWEEPEIVGNIGIFPPWRSSKTLSAKAGKYYSSPTNTNGSS